VVLLNEKVTKSAPSYVTALGAGVVKVAEERLLAPYIGNGTLWSGAIKLGIGYGIHHFVGGNEFGDMGSLGFTVDGVEDIIQGVLGPGLGGILGGGGNASAVTW
jgi:hypothetical protein